jgi:hypothetical protein
MSRARWALGADGAVQPAVNRSQRVTCCLCGERIAVRSAWQVPKGSGEFYCRGHWSTDDRRLRHEFGEAEP